MSDQISKSKDQRLDQKPKIELRYRAFYLSINQKNSSKLCFGVTSVIPAKAGIQIENYIDSASSAE